MFFSAPLYLLALLSLPIPFILHLFEKRRIKRMEFPWIRLVEESVKGGNLFLRLREWILLALRTLALLFLIMAFANPTLRKEIGIVLIDDSYDMFTQKGSGILFDEAKVMAEKISSEKGFEIHLSSGRQYTPSIQPSYVMYHPFEPQDEKTLFVTAKKVGYEKGVIYIEGEPNLLSIDTVYLKDPLPQLGTDNLLYVGVTNHGDHDVQRNVLIYLFGDSSYTDCLFSPGLNYFSIPVEFMNPGVYLGYIDIGDDALITDNRYYFAYNVPARITVGIVEEQTTGSSFYVEKALAPEGAETDVELRKGPYPGLPLVDVLIFIGEPYIESNIPSLVFIQGEVNKVSKGLYYSLEGIDRSHPIFSVFDDACIDEITSRKIYVRSTDDLGGDPIAFFSDGRHAIVEKARNIFFLFLPTVENTDLVLSPNFPPLLHRAIRYLSEGAEYPTMTLCGREEKIAVRESRTYDIKYLAGGKGWRVTPVANKRGLSISFKPNRPGFYSIDDVGEIAVNVGVGSPNVPISQRDKGRISLKSLFFLICLLFILSEMVVRNLRT